MNPPSRAVGPDENGGRQLAFWALKESNHNEGLGSSDHV